MVDKDIAEQTSQGPDGSGPAGSSAEKDPHDWVTGEEPATGPQESYLSTLAQQAGEEVDVEGLSKAEASMRIDELKEQTGR